MSNYNQNRSKKRTNSVEEAQMEQLVNRRKRASPSAVLPFKPVLDLTIRLLDEANRKLKEMVIAR